MASLDTVRLARLATALSDSKTALAAKGVSVPAGALLDDIPDLIAQVPSGGGAQPLTAGDNQVKFRVQLKTKNLLTATIAFVQSIANDVIVDFGDGSASQTSDKTGTSRFNCAMIEHTFPAVGEYVITLTATDGSLSLIGVSANSYGALLFTNYIEAGFSPPRAKSYQNCVSELAFGKNVGFLDSPLSYLGISSLRFYSQTNPYLPVGAKCLREIVFSGGETSIIGSLGGDHSLTTLTVPACLTDVIANFIRGSGTLVEVRFLGDIGSIAANAFYGCQGMRVYDFTHCTAVPTLAAANAFTNIPADCKIIVPDALAAEWKAATNWATYADNIISETEANT